MKTSFKQLLIMFGSFFLAQAVIIYLASMLLPGLVVLGTHMYSPLQALIQSMFIISLIAVAFTPVIEFLAKRYEFELKNKHWMILYFVINAAAIWFVARFAEMLGFGISSWLVAVALGLIFDIEQGLIMKQIASKDQIN